MDYLGYIPYAFIAGWGIFTVYYIIKANKDYGSVNPLILDHIPAVFTTLGVFGTFLGIAFGLADFNVENIDDSIPTLLSGLFVAFWSSIFGIFFSLLSQFFVQKIQNSVASEEGELVTEEQVLLSIATSLEEIRKAISSDADGSITTHLVKMRTSINDNLAPLNANMQRLTQSVGGEGDTSLLTQIQNLRLESKESQDQLVQIQRHQLAFMQSNKELVEKKFDEFTDLLKKSNTEALVEVIEKVIGGFNERLNELIERLVKENFDELNKSVENLNKWQQANKEQVEALLSQYKTLTEQLTISVTSIENVSKSTETLVGSDGKLIKLIDELNTITKDGDNTLVKSIENLEGSTKNYKDVSEELKKWFEQHSEFSNKIENLVDKLDEIEQLRNRAEGFFDDVRKEFEEAATILKQSNSNVKEQVDQMQEAFNNGMDRSFTALDSILRNMVLEYAERMNRLNN